VIKALLFDLGNVLVAFDFKRGYQALERLSRYGAEEIPRRISHAGLVHPYERGEISSQEFFQRLSSALELQIPYEQFCDLWSTIFLPDPLLPEALLAGLRRRYRMVLLSNTNDIHFQMIRRTYRVVSHFDAQVLSYEVGAMKPAPRIFEEAVRQAGCLPEECFYTDDVLEFVEAGRRFGLDVAQFQGRSRLEEELRRRGIEWDRH
jgi:HAD superfamily hydrolase (TIGR01509 family)